MPTSNERNNGKATSQKVGPGGNSERDADEPVTKSRSTYGIYVKWCYQFRPTWVLWYLIGKISKDNDRKTDDFKRAPTRVDSGVELHLLGQDAGKPSRPATSTPPTPVTLTFIFEDATSTRLLDYRVYSGWTNINALLNELALDGIVVHGLWDVDEDMSIGGGDWDARIQPGSVIYVWCFDNRSSDDREEDSDGSEDESGEEVECGCAYDLLKNRSIEHTWWFTRWRQRVEKTTPGRDEVTDEPSWFFIVVWCTSVVGIVIIVSVLSL